MPEIRFLTEVVGCITRCWGCFFLGDRHLVCGNRIVLYFEQTDFVGIESMNTVLLNDPLTGSTAKIAVDLGFNCFEFLASVGEDTISVIDSADGFADGGKPPSHSGIPLLFPFPNRIREGRYSWNGVDYHLPE